MVGFYVALFSLISILKYFSYSFHDFDLAIYAQGLWNFLHGSLESSILGIPLLGNHFVPILFLIVPLYACFPTPLTLLILQTLFLGGGAFFVHRIALRKFTEPLALGFAFSYLLYPALGYTNLFEFHPVALAVFFLLGALDAFEEARLFRFFLFLALASLCQEDVSLALVTLGVYALLQKKSWAWGVGPVLLGVGYFGAIVFKVMPLLNPETIHFSLLYSHLGETLPKAFLFILTHPFRTLALLVETHEKRIFVTELLAPLSFLPLCDPKSFLLSVPFFLEQLLSRRPTQHLLTYHYGALFIPLLYYAAIQGAARLLRWKRIRLSHHFLCVLIFFPPLAVNVWTGPHFYLGSVLEENRRDFLDDKRDLLVQEISKDSPVMATFEFLPHLSNRRELYSFHHVYTKRFTLSEKEYRFPETIQYLLVDFNDPLTYGAFYFFTEEGDKYAREFLEKGPFRVVHSFQDLVLFERGEGERLFRVERSEDNPKLMATDPDGKIGLSAWHAAKTKVSSGEAVPFLFEWYCAEPSRHRYGLLFEMVNKEKKETLRQYHSLCYRIYPTERWQKGERVIEKYTLVFPPPERGGLSKWTVALYLIDEKEGKTPVPLVSLGDFEVAT